MRFDTVSLEVPVGAAAGAPSLVGALVDKWIQFKGVAAAGATVQVLGTVNGTDYVQIGANVTTDIMHQVAQDSLYALKINRSVAGAGAITAVLAGHNLREG